DPGSADGAFAAVGLSGGDLALQAGGQELLVGPAFGAGSLGQPSDRLAQRRGLQRPGQEGQLSGQVPGGLGGGGRHQATPWVPSSRPKAASAAARQSVS